MSDTNLSGDNRAMQGSVYILSTPVHKFLKIGFTTKTAVERAKELYTTGVPDKFQVEYEACFIDAYDAEKQVHSALNQYRYSRNREFFFCDLATAKKAIDGLSDVYGRLNPPSNAKVAYSSSANNGGVFTEDRRHTVAANDKWSEKTEIIFFGVASVATFFITLSWSAEILGIMGL